MPKDVVPSNAEREHPIPNLIGQMEAADVKRLKALEIENGRLKKLLAERDLDIEVLKEINAKKW